MPTFQQMTSRIDAFFSKSRSSTRARNRSAKNVLRHKRKWLPLVRQAESKAQSMSDLEIKKLANNTRDLVADHGPDVQSLALFCGLACEANRRNNGFQLYDVQVQAVAAGICDAIVEMQTGEGKTVVTGVTAAVQTLLAPAVHVGTTNTYLAARDLESVSGIFDTLNISFGLLPEKNNESESRRAYRKQIVYGPGYQYGFDYLRDQMNLRRERRFQLGKTTANHIRGRSNKEDLIQNNSHHIALIDEADSVMIDEAMTPLIISLPSNRPLDPLPWLIAKKIVDSFEEGLHFTIDPLTRKIDIDEDTTLKAHQEIATRKNLRLERPWRVYLNNALRAEHILQRDVDYVVVDGDVQIVDQYTGRILPDRTWQAGLHQAIEAKENLELKAGRESTTQITRQRYLQMYDQLAGLTGTARQVTGEFLDVYKCRVIEIPTHKPCIRKRLRTRFFADLESKLTAITTEVCDRHRSQQPILVGTRTIRESHQVHEALLAAGLNPTLLNGVQDEEEADIVSRAGKAGAITIATNMAGRGTDIKLDEKALEAGGLHVVGFSPNSSPRIDRQLAGRAARQGQPGSVQFFTAATDDLFEDNPNRLGKQIIRRAKQDGESNDFSKELLQFQHSIEARKYKQRKDMIQRDKWMDTVREAIEKD